jgi:hypothetical protein
VTNPDPALQELSEDASFRKDKLVAHFKDGLVSRGFSRDFRPDAQTFHLLSWNGDVISSRKIQVDQLKALFHVKTWGSATRHSERRKEFPREPLRDAPLPVSAPRTIVEFYDGEEIWGYSLDYRTGAPGFYLVPADPTDNNQKIFVVSSSLVNIQFLDH